jgi:hypothetical protein
MARVEGSGRWLRLIRLENSRSRSFFRLQPDFDKPAHRLKHGPAWL